MIFISRPKHMRILDKRTRKKWVYFRNAKCNRNQTKQQQKLKYEGEKRKKTRVPTIKRWCIQTPPCIESTSRTCATSPRYNGFYSVLLLISEGFFSFYFRIHYYYRQSASLIYSDLCLVVDFMQRFVSARFFFRSLSHSLYDSVYLCKISLVEFICNLIPCTVYVHKHIGSHIWWTWALDSIERSITLFNVIIVLCVSRFGKWNAEEEEKIPIGILSESASNAKHQTSKHFRLSRSRSQSGQPFRSKNCIMMFNVANLRHGWIMDNAKH